MASVICETCLRETLYEGERPRFCAHCAAPFPAREAADEALFARLEEARATEDTAARHQLLAQLQKEYPDRFEVEREVLYLGRLYERGGKPDYYRIPFWPLDALYQPENYSDKQRAEMLDRFFQDPQLKKTLALAPDKDKCFDEFLDHMALQYVRMFFEGASANSLFFGFRRRGSEIARRCARCCAVMLYNIENALFLSEDVRNRLLRAMWFGFVRNFPNEPAQALLENAAGDTLKFRP